MSSENQLRRRIRLGVNVDHVATLRQARGEKYPSPIYAAQVAQSAGADNITCHLREDRRHIQDRDVVLLKELIHIPLNFEIAATPEMVAIAGEIQPHSVTLVPEKRKELTTEGGLDFALPGQGLEEHIKALKARNILVALFVEPDVGAIEHAGRLGADAVELHTGGFCIELQECFKSEQSISLLRPLQKAGQRALELGLQVHVGHGLHYQNAHWMRYVPGCEEANIGHAIVAQSLFVGFETAVRDMQRVLNHPEDLGAGGSFPQ